jgi:hypothetical protein
MLPLGLTEASMVMGLNVDLFDGIVRFLSLKMLYPVGDSTKCFRYYSRRSRRAAVIDRKIAPPPMLRETQPRRLSHEY